MADTQFDLPFPAAQLRAHTPGHYRCPGCEEVRATLLQSITADLPFAEAAARYLRLRSVASTPGAVSARYIRPHTERDYAAQLKSLELFFAQTPLREIHWYSMRAYQEARSQGAPPFIRYRRPQDAKPKTVNGVLVLPKGKTSCPAQPQQINKELRVLEKIKTLAGCWTAEDEKYFERLQEEESDVERALSPEQQKMWLDACRSRPRWDVVLWWSIVSFDLLTSTNELRSLQLGNLNLHHQIVRIPWPGSKNKFRHRDIPVEDAECLWALERLIARAQDMGAKEPQHFLFPFRITRKKICCPDRPMTESGLKKLWQEVRDATGVGWFRMYDTRHTGATRLAESGVHPNIIKVRMGHCSPKMQERYTHIFEQAQRQWLRASQGVPRMPARSEYPQYPHPAQNFFQKRY